MKMNLQYQDYLELAQFPVTALGEGVCKADLLSVLARGNHCLYQASSRSGGYNLTRLVNPEAGLTTAFIRLAQGVMSTI